MKTGIKGVTQRYNGRFTAQFYNSMDKSVKYLGDFNTAIEAKAAYDEYVKSLGPLPRPIRGRTKKKKKEKKYGYNPVPKEITYVCWRCLGCGAEYTESRQPKQCECGSISFEML